VPPRNADDIVTLLIATVMICGMAAVVVKAIDTASWVAAYVSSSRGSGGADGWGIADDTGEWDHARGR
jgi:hypothetical protein